MSEKLTVAGIANLFQLWANEGLSLHDVEFQILNEDGNVDLHLKDPVFDYQVDNLSKTVTIKFSSK